MLAYVCPSVIIKLVNNEARFASHALMRSVIGGCSFLLFLLLIVIPGGGRGRVVVVLHDTCPNAKRTNTPYLHWLLRQYFATSTRDADEHIINVQPWSSVLHLIVRP